MQIGLDAYTIEHRQLSADAALRFARDRGVAGLQFLRPEAIDAELDHGRLRAFRDEADALGLYLELGITSPNPIRQGRLEGRVVAADEHAATLARQLRAVHVLGCSHARAYVGDRHDRFRTDTCWADQLAASRDVLARLAPLCRELGIRVAVETHADLTVDELLRLVDDLGDDVTAVTLDTGNLVMRLDDPVRAVERLAPLVVCTHLKDAVLAFTPRGLCWQARPVGGGILPIPDMLRPLARNRPELNLSIELHPRTYDLPIFDPTWLAHFPELRAESLAAVVRLAWQCERRFVAGTLARPEVIEAIPWPDRDLDWLARSVGYLRPIVELLRGL